MSGAIAYKLGYNTQSVPGLYRVCFLCSLAPMLSTALAPLFFCVFLAGWPEVTPAT
jgi:hypothetical protein